MRRKTEKRFEKLLDQWQTPKDAGEAIGFISTTFTFHSAFFEEECISRFLLLETDPVEDGILYRIEREEKIRKTSCCGVWVDKTNCKGIRNIGWDLIPVKVSGTFHPKISVIYWANCIRLIIASANLTEDGYCRNQEVFGVLDYYPKEFQGEKQVPSACIITESLNFLQNILSQNLICSDKLKLKYAAFIDRVRQTISSWRIKNDSQTSVFPIFIGKGYSNCFQQLMNIWEKYESLPPDSAYITSPFYDNPNVENKPAIDIWNYLKQRGRAHVNYYLITDETEDKKFIRAPESIKFCPSQRNNTRVNLHSVNENLNEDDGKPTYRPLHAKSIWLEGNRHALFMIGSSNFTSNGLGLIRNRNYEANIVYVVDSKNSREYQVLEQSHVEGKEIYEDDDTQFLPETNSDQVVNEGNDIVNFFMYCELGMDNKHKTITFLFDLKYQVDDFIILDNEQPLFDSDVWIRHGKKELFQFIWDEDSVPCGFDIKINKGSIATWIPLNVIETEALPEIIELKKLPLDILTQIVGSKRPIHLILKRYYARINKESGNDKGGLTYLNPHKRVDTSRFLLQRTRKVSYSLNSLREKLSKPSYTEEALEWRMNGPVGVNALIKALIKDITNDGSDQNKQDEVMFFIAELLYEISNIEPQENTNSLKKTAVFNHIHSAITKIISEYQESFKFCPNSMIKQYSEKTMKVALKKLKDGMAI